MTDKILHDLCLLVHNMSLTLEDPTITPTKQRFLHRSIETLHQYQEKLLQDMSPPIAVGPDGMYVALDENAKKEIQDTVSRLRSTMLIYFP